MKWALYLYKNIFYTYNTKTKFQQFNPTAVMHPKRGIVTQF